MKPIKQSVINTFNRLNIPYKELIKPIENELTVIISNRFSGEEIGVNPLTAYLINWIYDTNNDFDNGIYKVNLSDFDRIKYFILDIDKNAYNTCID